MANETRKSTMLPRSLTSMKSLYEMYILKTLAQGGGTIYGKQVYDHLKEEFSNLNVPISYNTIYTTFHNMEEKGLIISRWIGEIDMNRNKRVYSITDDGIEYFKKRYTDYIDTLKRNKTTIDKFIEVLMR